MVSNAVLAHAAFGTATAVIILLLIARCFKKPKPAHDFQLGKVKSLEKGIVNIHAPPLAAASVTESARRRPSLHGFRRAGGGSRTLFNWADSPSLVTDAVETGWVRFAFTLSPSVRPTSLLGMCAAGESSDSALDTEISWEIGQASADFMQKVRLNPGMRVSSIRSNQNSSSNSSIMSAIRTALPLPGPVCAFPQNAYFEIIVLSCREEDEQESIKIREGEKMKLIAENGNAEHKFSDSNITPTGAKDDVRNSRGEGGGGFVLAVGLTVGGLLPMKLPGSYPGSIGFVSNGSLHHDGNKLVSEMDKGEWGHLTGKVIGCGFIPSEKKVIFTVDSELIHTITCTTEEFGTPLYPTLAANCDITVMINNGQSPFKYIPANGHRRPNPCFQGGNGTEDSKEFFSIGRIDSQWRNRSGARGSVYIGNVNNNRVKDFGDECDVDELFEIILESGNAPSTVGR